MKRLIKKMIAADIPFVALGKTGTGKSAIIIEAAGELGYDVVRLCLANIPPEDLGGIPRKKTGGGFTYELPEWFLAAEKKPTLLFLDEINQAQPPTLHAAYTLLSDRELHGRRCPGLRLAAAGNLEIENPFLTSIEEMKPLMSRLVKIPWEQSAADCFLFLEKKYPAQKTTVDILRGFDLENFRKIETALRLLEAGVVAAAPLEDCIGKPAATAVLAAAKNKVESLDIVKIKKIKKMRDLGIMPGEGGTITAFDVAALDPQYRELFDEGGV